MKQLACRRQVLTAKELRVAHRLTGITIDCGDPARLASFWSALLERAVTGEHGEDTGWATVGSRLDDQPRLTFQRVGEPKTAKVRIHLDVQVDDIDTARMQVERLGGRWSGERHDYDDGIVMVMHDPEGHEFCLVQYGLLEDVDRAGHDQRDSDDRDD
jgi:predicted enzyme related to lactoylglutathione lyase